MKTAHDVKLLNGSKQEVSYTGVETVTMPGTDGQDKVFTAGAPIDAMDISPDFSGGDMLLEAPEGYVVRGATIKKPEGAEQVIAKGQTLAGISGAYVTPGTAKEIEPDFSEGDQTVTAEEDERWSEVTIKKPETLVPENIAEGINISGVIGSLSKSVKVAKGTVDYSITAGTVYHNLGVVPDIVLMSVSSNTNNNRGIRLQFGVSSAFRAKYPGVYSILVNKIGTSNASYTQVLTSTSWTVDGTSVGCIYGADETKFKFGSSSNFDYAYVTNRKVWVAIGGLT